MDGECDQIVFMWRILSHSNVQQHWETISPAVSRVTDAWRTDHRIHTGQYMYNTRAQNTWASPGLEHDTWNQQYHTFPRIILHRHPCFRTNTVTRLFVVTLCSIQASLFPRRSLSAADSITVPDQYKANHTHSFTLSVTDLHAPWSHSPAEPYLDSHCWSS